MLSKQAIRQTMRMQLREVTPAACASLVSNLKHFAASWPPNLAVALYGGLRGEPDLLTDFLPRLVQSGHRAVLFAIEHDQLIPKQISSSADLIRSSIGALEPAPNCPSVEIAALDIIIVPGLAFNPHTGDRLGRGGGYYDRLLACPACKAHRIALAHEFQLISEIPRESHDQRVHKILTGAATYTPLK